VTLFVREYGARIKRAGIDTKMLELKVSCFDHATGKRRIGSLFSLTHSPINSFTEFFQLTSITSQVVFAVTALGYADAA